MCLETWLILLNNLHLCRTDRSEITEISIRSAVPYLFKQPEQEDWQRGVDHVEVGEAHAVVQRLRGVFVEEGEVDLRREGRNVLVEEVLDQQGHAHVEPAWVK